MRSLLAARFPEKVRRPCGGIPVSVRAIDEALGGGLPAGRLTEIVSAVPSGGGQTLIVRLLEAAQAARRRIALIDGADGFAPGEVPDDALRHLVWVRCSQPQQAFAAADILVRDGNYSAIVLDLRGCAERVLRRTPASTWYRLQRGAEGGAAAVLIQTPSPLVPAVPLRLVLDTPLTLADAAIPREAVAEGIAVRAERGRPAAERMAI